MNFIQIACARQSYSVDFEPDRIFEIQDELALRIVSTVADIHGVLPRTMGERLRARSPKSLTPYEP